MYILLKKIWGSIHSFWNSCEKSDNWTLFKLGHFVPRLVKNDEGNLRRCPIGLFATSPLHLPTTWRVKGKSCHNPSTSMSFWRAPRELGVSMGVFIEESRHMWWMQWLGEGFPWFWISSSVTTSAFVINIFRVVNAWSSLTSCTLSYTSSGNTTSWTWWQVSANESKVEGQ